jgi:hypothetical protein
MLQQHVKKIAGKSLFTKVLADFLSVIYLLTLVLKHATNLIHNALVNIMRKLLTLVLILNYSFLSSQTKREKKD